MKKTLLIFLLAFITLGISNTFAQEIPNDGDIRTLITTGAISRMVDWCDPYWSYAFYEWSDVFFLVYSEQLKVDNYWIFKNSNARKYWDIFSDGLQIPFNSSIQPKNWTADTPTNKVIVAKAEWWTFTIPTDYNTARNQIAWQLVTNTEYRLLRSTNPMRNYFFTNFLENKISIQASSNFSQNASWKKACVSYYIARCGDWIIDKATWDLTSDGQWWIITTEDGFKSWHANSIKPNEVCDDWAENWQPGKCKTDCSGIWDGTQTGNMIVTKTLTVEQNYTPQQNLQFRINFSNPGSQPLQNVSIEDFLPSGFEYISSEINGVTNALFSTGNAGGSLRIAYTWFSLNAGQNWYILINAKLLACNAALNIVRRSALSNWQTISWITEKQVECSTTPVSINKSATPNTIQWGQTVRFTITATNATPNTITDVRVEDVWPSCLSLVEWSVTTSMPATQTSAGNLTQWTLANWLTPWSSFSVSFSWLASTNASCVWTHINTGRIIFTDGVWIQQTQTNTTATISQASYQLSITKTVSPQTAWPGDTVTFTITYRNNWTAPLQGFRIVDYWPSTLIYKSSILLSTNQNLEPLNQNSTSLPLIWNFPNTILQPWQSDSIKIIWEIK